MFQESEIVTLVLALIACWIVSQHLLHQAQPGRTVMYLGFCLMVASHIFTVVEGVVWGGFCNFMEHATMAASGAAFALACFQMGTTLPQGKE